MTGAVDGPRPFFWARYNGALSRGFSIGVRFLMNKWLGTLPLCSLLVLAGGCGSDSDRDRVPAARVEGSATPRHVRLTDTGG